MCSCVNKLTHLNWYTTDIPTHKTFIGLFQKKSKQGGLDILFWKSPLEILDLSLYPKKFQRKKAFTLGNSVNLSATHWKFLKQKPRPMGIPHYFFLNTPGISTYFLIDPWNFHMYFLQDPRKFHVLNPPCLDFLWNSPLTAAVSQF